MTSCLSKGCKNKVLPGKALCSDHEIGSGYLKSIKSKKRLKLRTLRKPYEFTKDFTIKGESHTQAISIRQAIINAARNKKVKITTRLRANVVNVWIIKN